MTKRRRRNGGGGKPSPTAPSSKQQDARARTIILSPTLGFIALLGYFIFLGPVHSLASDPSSSNDDYYQPKGISTDSNGEVLFPPMAGWEDILGYSRNQNASGLHWFLSNVFRQSERNPIQSEVKHKLPHYLARRGGGSTYTTRYKLDLDLEQAEYLLEEHLNGKDDAMAKHYREVVIPTLRKSAENTPPLEALERHGQKGGMFEFVNIKGYMDAGLGKIYNKAFHLTDYDTLRDEEGNPIDLLNSDFDEEDIYQQWFGKTHSSNADRTSESPSIAIIDNILTQDALHRIRQILMESTVWFETKYHPSKKFGIESGGYAGAYINDGLYDRILIELAYELQNKLPRIMKDHPLYYLWAYKYGDHEEFTGIGCHADIAAVNVNLWITPDEANLDPESGGLVIFRAKPPDSWTVKERNNAQHAMDTIIAASNYANVTVPYRQNRAVIFDSSLFHQTDNYRFKKGYKNRRINLTILYGEKPIRRGEGGSGMHNVKSEL